MFQGCKDPSKYGLYIRTSPPKSASNAVAEDYTGLSGDAAFDQSLTLD